jgi:hypothetical protein
VITDFPKDNQGVRQALINSGSLRDPLVTIDGERGVKICCSVFLAARMRIEKTPSKTDEHTPGRCPRVVSYQNLVAEVQNRGSFMQRPSSCGGPLLTLGLQIEAFLQKSPFASARIIAKHFMTSASTVKEIPQRELGMRQFSRRRELIP